MKGVEATDATLDHDAVWNVVEAEVSRLEEVSCRGTQISRVQMDNSLVIKEGLKHDPEREFTWVWSVMWGSTATPPLDQVFGNTMREAVERAVAQENKSKVT